VDERIESLRVLFGEAVKQMGFTAKEQLRLLGGKRLDNPSAFDSTTTHDLALTLVHASAVFHTWSASFEDVRAYVRADRLPMKEMYAGEFATVAEAFLSRDLIKFEDVPRLIDKRFLDWVSDRRRGKKSEISVTS
jgi:hypothetical protein